MKKDRRGQVRIEWGVVAGVEQEDYESAFYVGLTNMQLQVIVAMLDEFIRPDWDKRSGTPS